MQKNLHAGHFVALTFLKASLWSAGRSEETLPKKE